MNLVPLFVDRNRHLRRSLPVSEPSLQASPEIAVVSFYLKLALVLEQQYFVVRTHKSKNDLQPGDKKLNQFQLI